MFAFIPVLINFAIDKNNVALFKAQFPKIQNRKLIAIHKSTNNSLITWPFVLEKCTMPVQ